MTTNNSVNTTLSGQTGTGSFAGSLSPTLTTPTLGVATATSINFGGTALTNYLQGTFTPVLTGSGGGSATYVTQIGGYTQIGNRILYDIYIVISGSTLVGNITFTGLPQNAASQNFACAVWANNLGVTAITQVQALVNAGTTVISLYKYAAGVASALSSTDFGTVGSIAITGSYHV